jgi:hypothetical protein
VCPHLAHVACGQATQNPNSELDIALTRAKSGNADARDVVVIANAGLIQAIPDLEKQFSHATDIDTKVSLASGLVRLRDQDDTYWNYLLEQATLAVDSNIPDSNFSQSEAKMMIVTPELQAWADSHKVSFETAFQYARVDIPGKILRLGTTGDSRGIPLLRRALQARNYLMASWAAKGLAVLQDKESIPLIIAAVQKAPTGYNSLIAESLVYFDDAQAQSAVDTYLEKDRAKMNREEKSRGRGVFGW